MSRRAPAPWCRYSWSLQVVDFGEPNNTLYIKNLNEKYSKAKVLDELKEVLRKKFSPYGEILDIVALSNFYSKGQVSLAT
jgi:RNA recognition motif-containing protein